MMGQESVSKEMGICPKLMFQVNQSELSAIGVTLNLACHIILSREIRLYLVAELVQRLLSDAGILQRPI